MTVPVVLIVTSYLLGAVPSSYLVGRMARGIDLRRHGSGNLGATNTYRVLGWRLATPVFLFDVGKGFVPTWFFPQWDGAGPAGWTLAYGVAAIVGHVFSIYVGFRGGKGVATSAGVFLALDPLALLVGLLVWGALVLTTRIVSVASISAALVVPCVVLLTRGPGGLLWLSVALAAFIVFAHRSNIRRLLRGQEPAFRGSPRSADPTS